MAAGTADGRLWLGWGGQKLSGKKKTRKWGGLNEEESTTIKIAEGPLVGMYVLPNLRYWVFLNINAKTSELSMSSVY